MSGDEIYKMAKDSLCLVTTTRGGSAVGFGTGIVISADGLIATNRHVVEDGDGILVKCGDRKATRAQVFASYGEDLQPCGSECLSASLLRHSVPGNHPTIRETNHALYSRE
ncbi:trypsin-like peptidase domain-containing protein [Azospirillum soli]|uniref:trypsin-like peptidase domain-containing protein n=1 Tax=Azospirillum soli TaxID=1304799 RepID=UPI001AE75F99|nr:trypsin-like peptidase domain-containing protein [Azospirillum soli]MBP2315477.1 hypothetical protein [Azospirillum soli]